MAKNVDVRIKATVEGAESIQQTTDSLEQLANAGGQAMDSIGNSTTKFSDKLDKLPNSLNGAKSGIANTTNALDNMANVGNNASKVVGSVSNSTSNLSDLLTKLPGGLGGVASGFMSMTKSALQFLATPIGAVIGAIGVVLAAFTKAIKDSDAAMDALSEVTAVFSGIVKPVFQFLETIAVKVLGALADGLEAVASLFGSSGSAARQLAKDMDALEESELRMDRARAQTNQHIAEAKEIMTDSNATILERRRALEQVRHEEEKLSEFEVQNAKERRRIVGEEIKQGELSMELKEKLIQADINLAQVQQDQAAKRRQFNKMEKQLIKEEEAKADEQQKAAQERAKAALEIEKQALKDRNKAIDDAYLANIRDEEVRAVESLMITQKNQDAETQVKIDALEKIKNRTKEENKALKALRDQQAQEQLAQGAAMAALLDQQAETRKKKKEEDDKKTIADAEAREKKAFDDQIKLIDDAYKKETLLLINSEEDKAVIKAKQDKLDEDHLKQKIATFDLYCQDTIDLELELANKKKELRDEEAAAEQKLFETKIKNLQAVFSLSSTTITAIAELRQLDQENALAAIDARYEEEFTKAEGNEELMKELEDKKLKELNETRKKQFEDNKSLQYATALLNGAQAVTSIIAQYPKFDGGIAMTAALIAAGVTITAQLLKIKNTQFVPQYGSHSSSGGAKGEKKSAYASGGLVSGPGTGTSDSIAARLSNGESVINARSTEMFSGLLSLINQAGGGRPFAEGGMAGGASTSMPVIKTYVVASEMTSQQEADFRIQQVARL